MGAGTSKIFQTASFQPENGKTGAGQSLGWGDPASWKIPGATEVIPYINLGNKPTLNHVEDNSVTSNAAKSAPRLTGIRVDQSFSFYARYNNLFYWLYWMFGFQNEPLPVFIFEKNTAGSPWGTAEPAQGITFEDTSLTVFTYNRTFKGKDVFGQAKEYYVFNGSTAPDVQAGVLNEVGGSAEVFTYTDASVQSYEHLFELDKEGRQYRDYTAAEQVTGWAAGDKKNLMATICKRFAQYDMRYGNATCRSWTFNLPVGDVAQFETNFLAYKPDRSEDVNGDPVQFGFGSDTWTIQPNLNDNENVPAHFQSLFEIGPDVNNLVTECMMDVSISAEIPLQQVQSTCSGLYLDTPVLENKYDCKMSANISRHETTKYQYYRDNNTRLFARYAMNWGFLSYEFLMKNVVLKDSGADDSDVAEELLDGAPSACSAADNQWATEGWLFGHTEVQNMPIVLRVINTEITNYMFEY